MHTPDSKLRSRLARVILVAAMVSLVALFATTARAQTDTATPATPTPTPAQATPTPAALPTTDDDDDVRLPATGGGLATLALAGLTIVELGAGLMLLAGRRKRS